MATIELMSNTFNAKKKDQKELEELQKQVIAKLDTEYERYAQKRRNLLKEKKALIFWEMSRKKEIDKALEKVNIELQNCLTKKSQAKKEFNSKYTQINKDIVAEEKVLQSKKEKSKLLIDKRKS